MTLNLLRGYQCYSMLPQWQIMTLQKLSSLQHRFSFLLVTPSHTAKEIRTILNIFMNTFIYWCGKCICNSPKDDDFCVYYYPKVLVGHGLLTFQEIILISLYLTTLPVTLVIAKFLKKNSYRYTFY